jgi:hypothetical protein
MSTVVEPRRAIRQPVMEVPAERGRGTPLRLLGATALLVVGGAHLEQYFGVHFRVVPVIGPLFLLNFIGSVLIAAGLFLPLHRLHPLLALGGIAVGVASIVFFELSEHGGIFGFQDYGYRIAIVVALAAEAAAAVLLAAYLVLRR